MNSAPKPNYIFLFNLPQDICISASCVVQQKNIVSKNARKTNISPFCTYSHAHTQYWLNSQFLNFYHLIKIVSFPPQLLFISYIICILNSCLFSSRLLPGPPLLSLYIMYSGCELEAAGDTVICGIENIGEIENKIVQKCEKGLPQGG